MPLASAICIMCICIRMGSFVFLSQVQCIHLLQQPSRELARQTYENIINFKKYLPPPGIRYVLICMFILCTLLSFSVRLLVKPAFVFCTHMPT